MRHAHAQARNELDEATKFAELLYEVLQRVGFITDFLLKKHLMMKYDRNPESMEAMINIVEKQAYAEACVKPEGNMGNINDNGGTNV